MKKMKYLLALLTLLALSLTFFACGGDSVCTSHTDIDNNGKCDTCSETVETNNNENNNTQSTEIALIKDGKVNFQIVHPSNVGGGVMMLINTLKMTVESIGGSLDIVDDKAGTEKDIEVLIGDVTSRGEKYTYDKYSLGMKGYVIKAIDNKIIINAGSADTLPDAVEEFIEDILGIKSSTKALSDVTMTSEDDVVKIQDDYRITSVKINGEEINGYTIAYDKDNAAHATAASSLNKFLYEKAGYYLPLVSLSEAGRSIIFEAVDYAGEEGFLIKTDESGALKIQCAYSNMFEKAWNEFSNELRIKTGDIDFSSSYKYTYEASVVYYDDYLHLSQDGNDYPALKAAHDFANECGQTVKATKGKTYTIGKLGSYDQNGFFHFVGPIIIKTNVDWSTAKFIVDDTVIESFDDKSNHQIFRANSDYSTMSLTPEEIAEIFPGAVDADTLTEINWKYDFPAMVELYNSEHKQYIRYGGDANDGSDQMEFIIVDENGAVDPTSRLMFDYEKVTRVDIIRTDVTPITIKGGEFTTLASQIECKKRENGSFEHSYFNRGIQVRRPGTTLYGVKHYIENEIQAAPNDPDIKGVAYYGFLSAQHAANVTFENCIFTAHRYYSICGSYDFTAIMVHNMYLKNCTQTNYYVTDSSGNTVNSMHNNVYWGIGATNKCKNLVYDTCELTRYDAHEGLYNGKLINSKVTMINLVGGGDMLIENCDIEPKSDNIVYLRWDYGGTWDGTVTIKNCRVKNPSSVMYVISAGWANHYFGYTCHLPNVIIDGITFSSSVSEVGIFMGYASSEYYTVKTEEYMHTELVSNGTKENVNIIAPPSFITLLNDNGYYYTLYDVAVFDNTAVTGNITKILP